MKEKEDVWDKSEMSAFLGFLHLMKEEEDVWDMSEMSLAPDWRGIIR